MILEVDFMKKRIVSILCILTLVLSISVINFPVTTHARTITVNTTSALQTAVANASPGDVIVLADGTYHNAGKITLQNYNGTADNKITIRAATPGGVVFTGKVTIYIKGNHLVFRDFHFNSVQFQTGDAETSVIKLYGSSYCEISNNYFYNCGNATNMGVENASSYGVYTHMIKIANGSTHNTISHNTIQKSISISIALVVTNDYDNSYNTIAYNYFKDIPKVTDIWGNVSGGNGMECIQLGQGDLGSVSCHTTVKGNLFENVIGDQAEVISVKCSDNIIYGNTFRNCDAGLVLRCGNNNIVDSNFMFNTKGIRVYENNHIIRNNYVAYGDVGINIDGGNNSSKHYASNGVQVINNTLVYNRSFGIVLNGSRYSNPPENTVVYNNFVMNDSGTAIKNYSSINSSYAANLCQITAPGAQGVSTGVSKTSVAFMTLSGELYRPSSISSLIDKGVEVDGLTLDMDGQVRTGRPDCGADEYSTDSVENAPLTVYDVGPTDKWWLCGQPGSYYNLDGNVDSYIEAEWFESKGNYTNIINDSNRSGGKYIEISEDAGDNKSSVYTSYTLNVTNGGTFYVWAHGNGPDTSSDSIKIQVDDGEYVTIYQNAGRWHWEKSQGTITLEDGIHTFKVCDREDGTWVDKLFFTKSSSASPTISGIPLVPVR